MSFRIFRSEPPDRVVVDPDAAGLPVGQPAGASGVDEGGVVPPLVRPGAPVAPTGCKQHDLICRQFWELLLQQLARDRPVRLAVPQVYDPPRADPPLEWNVV